MLRVPEMADVPLIVAYYLANRRHLEPWSPAWPLGYFTEDFWREQVRAIRSDHAAGAAVRFYLAERGRPSALIGNLALTQIQRGPAQSCIMGYGLAEAAQGRGYMVEAVRRAVAFAFEDLGLHRVSANYMPRNHRSAAVLRRAGFTIEGYARSYLKIGGRWEDHVLTSIVRPETEV